jgi:tight adherence protein C
MIALIYDKISNPQFMTMILVGIATAATVITVALPLVEGDVLGRRMKAVALERDRIRLRERERLAQSGKVSLRQEPKAYMKQIVERLNLGQWLGTETAKQKLQMAGYRGAHAEIAFLFFRLVMPLGFMIFALFYLFVVNTFDQPPLIRIAIVIGSTLLGIKAPEIFLSNQISKRQVSIRRAWPDALDLLLICVESGMSIEQAFRRVSLEIGSQSIPLAEELTLTTAELSYLPERRLAYEHLATRTGLETVKWSRRRSFKPSVTGRLLLKPFACWRKRAVTSA